MTEAISSGTVNEYTCDAPAVANDDGDNSNTDSIIVPHFENDASVSLFARLPMPRLQALPLPRFVSSQPASLPACVQPVCVNSASPIPIAASKAGNPIPQGVHYRDEICRAAQAHGLDPLLLAGVAAQETGGPGSNSGANVLGADGTGHGVFQIDSGTWETWLSTHHNGMNVAENADKAATILSDNLKATGGDIKKALHLYNAGSESRPTTRTTWSGGESLDYESSVMQHVAVLENNGK